MLLSVYHGTQMMAICHHCSQFLLHKPLSLSTLIWHSDNTYLHCSAWHSHLYSTNCLILLFLYIRSHILQKFFLIHSVTHNLFAITTVASIRSETTCFPLFSVSNFSYRILFAHFVGSITMLTSTKINITNTIKFTSKFGKFTKCCLQ